MGQPQTCSLRKSTLWQIISGNTQLYSTECSSNQQIMTFVQVAAESFSATPGAEFDARLEHAISVMQNEVRRYMKLKILLRKTSRL